MNSDSHNANPGLSALAALRRFARPQRLREQCDLCSAELADEHSHLLELSSRRLACACEPCAILFSGQTAARFRRVPRRAELLSDFHLTDLAWASLQLPVNLAFFVNSTLAGGVVVLYPSPGGATEATLPAEAWQMLVEDNPVLDKLEADVEALLVNRVGEARDCYRAGIDQCYKLVGLIRTHWQGFSGGAKVWEEIGRFMSSLKERSGPRRNAAHA